MNKWTKVVKAEVEINNKVRTKEEWDKLNERETQVIGKIISNIENDLKKYKKDQNWVCKFLSTHSGLIYSKNRNIEISIYADRTFSDDQLKIMVTNGRIGFEDNKFFNDELPQSEFNNIFKITNNDIDYIVDMIVNYILQKDKEID